MCCGLYARSTALTASAVCACRCTAAASCALPVGPGAIWTRPVRSSEEQQRQAALRRPPAHRQRLTHRRQSPPPRSRPPAAAARPRSADPPAPRASAPARPDLAQRLAAFQAALAGSPGAAYLQQRGIPLALAQQCGVGYAASGTWPHAARDWRGGRVVFPHTTPDGRLVNLYGRAVGPAEQVPKAKRHDHLPGVKGYFNAMVLQAGVGPLSGQAHLAIERVFRYSARATLPSEAPCIARRTPHGYAYALIVS